MLSVQYQHALAEVHTKCQVVSYLHYEDLATLCRVSAEHGVPVVVVVVPYTFVLSIRRAVDIEIY